MSAPLSPPDTTESGAITIPRQLQRWLDINRVTKLDRTQGYLVMPAFAVQAAWNGYSEIVLAIGFNCPKNFSLLDIQEGGIPQVASFVPPSAPLPVIAVTLVQGGGLVGHGSPEGAVAANPGTSYLDLDSGNFWVKVQGTGTTGWTRLIA